jgi:signal transduction histidine kinase
VLVKFSVHGNNAELVVIDNGKGISDEYQRDAHSFGILGMTDRASRFGGTLTVKRLAEKGTSITARIPRAKL